MTGVAIGSAIAGMSPILTHQRLDFALLAIEQMVNQAAKWHYMFGGRTKLPLVIRLIIGRGWGQGPQHSQSLHAWFAHVPGLKVVMPSRPTTPRGCSSPAWKTTIRLFSSNIAGCTTSPAAFPKNTTLCLSGRRGSSAPAGTLQLSRPLI